MADNIFNRIKKGLTKTKNQVGKRVNDLIGYYKEINEDFYEELEEILVLADIGMDTVMEIMGNIRERARKEKPGSTEIVRDWLKAEIVDILSNDIENQENFLKDSPSVLLVVGVNGVGKTTLIGKLAQKYKNEGKTVMLAAADTFRAAAADQLVVWGERSGVRVISHGEGADPAAVVFDAIQAAKSKKTDVLIIDTAGRLHNKVNLMNEIKKIKKIVNREYADANKETMLVLDATTGQNAVEQAKAFCAFTEVTAISMTKLDGTAKGGVIVGICANTKLPVRFIGLGEKIEDYQIFDPEAFTDAIFDVK